MRFITLPNNKVKWELAFGTAAKTQLGMSTFRIRGPRVKSPLIYWSIHLLANLPLWSNPWLFKNCDICGRSDWSFELLASSCPSLWFCNEVGTLFSLYLSNSIILPFQETKTTKKFRIYLMLFIKTTRY